MNNETMQILLGFIYFYIFRFTECRTLFSFLFETKINKVLEFNAIRFPCFETSAALF